MWNVFFKEVREVLRDKRTLMFMLLMPAVVMPALLFGYLSLAKNMARQESVKELRYAVVAADGAPLLKETLAAARGLQLLPAESEKAAREAIAAHQLDFALVLNGAGERDILEGRQPIVSLVYNTATVFDGVGKRVKPLLGEAYTKRMRAARLQLLSVDASAAEAINSPYTLAVFSTASERERMGETMGSLIPYLLLMLGLSASLAVAIDMGAGEKERGTLESLLLLPTSRANIVLAKFLIILSVGAICGTIGITSLGVCAGFMLHSAESQLLGSLLQDVGVLDFLQLALLMLPAYGILAALLLAVSFFARSHKEAASYGTQLMIFLIVPILVAMLPGMKLQGALALVPITNISLAIKELVKGTLTAGSFALVLGSTVAVAAALLALCIQWCKREAILFRS
jgi:sodium transport system permease protein